MTDMVSYLYFALSIKSTKINALTLTKVYQWTTNWNILGI